MEKQSKAFSKFTGYSKRVLEKLRNHPDYGHKSADALSEDVKILSEKEDFRRTFFSAYIEGMSTEVVEETVCDATSRSPESPEELRRKAKERYDRLFNVDMNLIIRAPSRRDTKTQAAKAPVVMNLQVGTYLFGWNEYSLIVPLEYRKVQTEPLLLSPVLSESTWCDVVNEVKVNTERSIVEAVDKKDYSMQIEIHYDLTRKKDEMLSAFIDTVLRFNRCEKFSWRCNNKHFVKAAMQSLGISNPPKLSATVAEHICQLCPSKEISRRQINDHQQLDAVATEVLDDDLSRSDIEFLIAKYFLFHVTGWEDTRNDGAVPVDKWECAISSCKQQDLTRKLGKKTSISSDN